MAKNKADRPKRKSETTLDNKVVRQENKIQLRQLEKMYVDGVIDDLEEIVAKKKEEIVEKLNKFYIENTEKSALYNPYIINSYFFKSINPMPNHEPKYTAEKLGIVWELYQDILTEVNMKIGEILPSLSSFCKFAGITVATFKGYKNSPDEGLRILVEKINDECFDSQVTMAQNGLLKERSTIYRMKAEQERIEKETPAIHIHENTVDVGSIVNRLKEIKQYNDKKGAIEVEGGTEYEQ